MKILVIWSSPNADGLTATAKNQIIKGIENTSMKAEEIQLNTLKIEHCRACGNGFGSCQKGSCIIEDDFDSIYSKIQEAQGIIWISAVYWHDLTECMKAFLDRLRRLETSHNSFLAGKNCMIVACAGGTGLGVIPCLNHLEEILSHMRMRTVDRLPVIQFNKKYMLPALTVAGETFAKQLENA